MRSAGRFDALLRRFSCKNVRSGLTWKSVLRLAPTLMPMAISVAWISSDALSLEKVDIEAMVGDNEGN